jgi:hypothetical protein
MSSSPLYDLAPRQGIVLRPAIVTFWAIAFPGPLPLRSLGGDVRTQKSGFREVTLAGGGFDIAFPNGINHGK